jgi:cytochrome c biogenesis protein CcdA
MQAMGSSEIPIIAAFFIGLMMVISPCPLATNITAIAYISRKLSNVKYTFLVGLFYTFGRMFTYIIITFLVVWLGINVQIISLGLQSYGEIFLGPLLIIIGVVFLEVIKFPSLMKENKRLTAFKEKLSEKGIIGAFILGVIFALAFCPFSAVLFFAMLIPLALVTKDVLFIPASFALATGLPVIILSLILTKSVSSLGKTMHKIQLFEKWMRKAIAIIFLVIGVYYTLSVSFGLFL